MLGMNDLKLGRVISFAGNPFVVTYAQHVQMGRGSAVLRTKLRNLITGQMLEETFKHGDRIEEADLSRSKANFLYREGDEFHFMDNTNYEQFSLSADQVGELQNFVRESADVEVLNFEGKPVAIDLPKKVQLKIIQAGLGTRGNTAQGNVTKPATLETGYEVQVPLFVKEGDVIVVNTESGEYVARV